MCSQQKQLLLSEEKVILIVLINAIPKVVQSNTVGVKQLNLASLSYI